MTADSSDGVDVANDWRRTAPVVDELPLVDPSLSPARRLAIAFELFEVGGRMRGQRQLKEHPEADAAEVDAVVRQWRAERSGAPLGDVTGRVRARPAR
ncbi:MAG: hypothetical protein ACR2JF_01395 [Iamia sp.]